MRGADEGELPAGEAAVEAVPGGRSRGLKHRSAGRPSNRAHEPKFGGRCCSGREKYSGLVGERFGPTLAAEHLGRRLQVDAETLRRWMLAEGLWRRERKREPIAAARAEGALWGVGADGRQFPRLAGGPRPGRLPDEHGGRRHQHDVGAAGRAGNDLGGGDRCAVDREVRGAAGAVHGLEKRVCAAGHARERLRGEVPVTQFGCMCEKLGIRIIAANSPQAKGRVERNHGTHQDRLMKKMGRKKIRTHEQRIVFLQEEYLPDHNQFRASRPQAGGLSPAGTGARELEQVFRLESERRISNDWVVRYDNRYFQLEPQSRKYAPAQGKVVVCEWQDGTIKIEYRGRALRWREIAAPVPPQVVWRKQQPARRTHGSADFGEETEVDAAAQPSVA